MATGLWLHWPKEHTKEDWILGFPLREKEEKEKKAIDVQELRYQKIVDLLELWKQKAKRAMNKIRIYQVKARRYERVFAAKRKEV